MNTEHVKSKECRCILYTLCSFGFYISVLELIIAKATSFKSLHKVAYTAVWTKFLAKFG